MREAAVASNSSCTRTAAAEASAASWTVGTWADSTWADSAWSTTTWSTTQRPSGLISLCATALQSPLLHREPLVFFGIVDELPFVVLFPLVVNLDRFDLGRASYTSDAATDLKTRGCPREGRPLLARLGQLIHNHGCSGIRTAWLILKSLALRKTGSLVEARLPGLRHRLRAHLSILRKPRLTHIALLLLIWKRLLLIRKGLWARKRLLSYPRLLLACSRKRKTLLTLHGLIYSRGHAS